MRWGASLGQHLRHLSACHGNIAVALEAGAHPVEQVRRVRWQAFAFARSTGRIEQVIEIHVPAGHPGQVSEHYGHGVTLVGAAFDNIAGHIAAIFGGPAKSMRAPSERKLPRRWLFRRHRRDESRHRSGNHAYAPNVIRLSAMNHAPCGSVAFGARGDQRAQSRRSAARKVLQAEEDAGDAQGLTRLGHAFILLPLARRRLPVTRTNKILTAADAEPAVRERPA